MSKLYQRSKLSTIGVDKGPEIRGYEDLANAIIVKAVRDYQHALIELHFNPESTGAKHTVKETERFFRSQWFATLTKADPDYIMKAAKQQIVDRNYKRFDVDY